MALSVSLSAPLHLSLYFLLTFSSFSPPQYPSSVQSRQFLTLINNKKNSRFSPDLRFTKFSPSGLKHYETSIQLSFGLQNFSNFLLQHLQYFLFLMLVILNTFSPFSLLSHDIFKLIGIILQHFASYWSYLGTI